MSVPASSFITYTCSIYGQKHAYTKSIIALWNEPWPSYLDRVWVGNMIPCLIWPLSVSWHHHNGLGTCIYLHIMTSAYLCNIDCISVNIDRFSSKFRYGVAETILYKVGQHHFSFWCFIIVKITIKGHISEISYVACYAYGKWISFTSLHQWHCFLAVSRLFLLYFVSNFSWPAHLYLFKTSIMYSLFIIIYFSYFDPLFC